MSRGDLLHGKSVRLGTAWFVITVVVATQSPNKAIAVSADLGAVVHGNSQFAFDVYRSLAAGTDGENVFFSPMSISTALSMTYAGARGQTAHELAQALRLPLPQDRLHLAYEELLTDLSSRQHAEYELTIANRLWGQNGFPFHQSFLDVTRHQYSAELGIVDFLHHTETARETINDWVAHQTHDRIPELLPQGSLTSDTRLVLTNAIYFLGDWQQPFAADDTHNAQFNVSPTEQLDVSMMHQTGSFRYAQLPHAQMLEMPYKGDDISMLLVLPNHATELATTENWLNAETLNSALDSLELTRVEVHLPKFQIETGGSIKGTLVDLGISTAFSDFADFSGIADANLSISDVVHEAFLRVDEKGTEAAAATGVVIGVTSLPPPASAHFRADHPFLVAMRDNRTESLLFMGRVMRPDAIADDDAGSGSGPLLGDYDGNGRVDQGDLDLVLLHWGSPSVPPVVVNTPPGQAFNQTHLDAVLLNWGATSANLKSASIPEPESWLLACATLIILWLVCRQGNALSWRRSLSH